MAITLVKSTTNTPGSNASTATALFTGGNTGGNLLIAVVAWNNSGRAFTSIADTIGNTWTAATTLVSTSTALLRIYYAFNCKATASNNTVTLTIGGGANVAVTAYEYSGLLSSSIVLDQPNTGSGTTANPTTAPITNITSGDLVFAACNIVSTTLPTAGTGFTRLSNTEVFTTNSLVCETQIDSGTGTFTGSWTASAAQYATGIASFSAASGGGGGVTNHFLSALGAGA
jgi:hypothetical protein